MVFIFLIVIMHADPCTIPQGASKYIENTQLECNVVLVQGTLSVGNNVRVQTRRLQVDLGGKLSVGTESQPAENVEIDLQHTDCGSSGDDQCLSDGQLYSQGVVEIFGKEKTSWTMLQQDCNRCGVIKVKDCTGWQEGDVVVVAPTGGDGTTYQAAFSSFDNFKAEERVVNEIGAGCEIMLDSPLSFFHRGSYLFDVVPVFAEVMNMNRSVTITGPMYWWDDDHINGGQGIVTIQAFSGSMNVRYTRVENCGRMLLANYCLHFHRVGECHDCAFEGNVVTNSINKAITVHGTQYSSVTENVVYDHRGAFMYVEDGNEYRNSIDNNCLVCPEISNAAPVAGLHEARRRCALLGVPAHRNADYEEQSGLYVISPLNNFRENHIVGMDVAWYFHPGVHLYGEGATAGLTCTGSLPFGEMAGNVFHGNARWGWYVNVAYPMNVQLDTQGLTYDWRTCIPFDMDTGADMSANVVVTNHVDYHTTFSMGVYDMGDLSFDGAISAMNHIGLYYKTYRRGLGSKPLCSNCQFLHNEEVMEGPGGSGLVEFTNLKAVATNNGQNVVVVNHACGLQNEMTGGLCASHYLFDTVMDNVHFTSEVAWSDVVIFYGSKTWFLTAGNRAFALPRTATQNCQPRGPWTVCEGLSIRIVRIYSPNRGPLTVKNVQENAVYTVEHIDIPKYQGNTRYSYTPSCQGATPRDCANYLYPAGYTFLVQSSLEYEIHVPTYTGPKSDYFVMEYSEPQLPQTSVSITITGDVGLEGSCLISSSHKRDFITPYGALIPQAGAWYDCTQFATRSGASEFLAEVVDPWEVNLPCSPGSQVHDVQCVFDPVPGTINSPGSSQSTGCRYCDSEPFRFCANRDVPYHPGASAPDSRPFTALSRPLTGRPGRGGGLLRRAEKEKSNSGNSGLQHDAVQLYVYITPCVLIICFLGLFCRKPRINGKTKILLPEDLALA